MTPTSRTAASSSKAAGRMRRRGTERMMTLHPYAPVPGTQLGWSVLSYARVLARVLACPWVRDCRELAAVDTRSSEASLVWASRGRRTYALCRGRDTHTRAGVSWYLVPHSVS